MKRIIFSSEKFGYFWADMGLVIFRLSAGLMLALARGLPKIPPDDRFVAVLETNLDLPLPHVFAWLVGGVELFGGFFIALGFLTRISSIILSLNFFVVVFIFHISDPFSKMELGLLYFFISLTLVLTGPGRYSFDYLLKRQKESI